MTKRIICVFIFNALSNISIYICRFISTIKMSRENKKSCLDHYGAPQSIKSLYHICNWNYLDNIAIEYHDLITETVRISYARLNGILMKIHDILIAFDHFEFIGISHDIQGYCIPPLILGIIAASHAFVNLPGPGDDCTNLLSCLNVKYLFACHSIPDTTILARLKIDEADILLLELQQIDKEKRSIDPVRYAYAITTSGSTNIPKIVKVPHACILPNIQDLKKILNATEHDKVVQLTTFTFDPSIVEVFLAFSCGGTLVMVSKNLKHDADRLLQTIHEYGVTILQSTPSVLLRRWSSERLITTIFNKDSRLRVLLLGGDPFPNINALMKVVHPKNKTRIFNIYGITEVSCWASINEIVRDDNKADPTYLGTILSDTLFQIRNEEGEILERGEGTLHIGSASRICTIDNETFLDIKPPVFRDTSDIVTVDVEGRVFYKGRRNRVVKRLGNKLNLRKLDESVQDLHFVQSSYSWWDTQNLKLHLFLTTTEPTTKYTELKTNVIMHLKKLPAFYKPDTIQILDRFELTTNGKICTHFLEEAYKNYAERHNDLFCVPQNAVEATFRNTWTNYVRFEDYGFIKSGGTSVDALQISLTLSDSLKLEFPELIGMLLRDATYSECLRYINHLVFHDNLKSRPISLLSTSSKQQISVTEKVVDNNVEIGNTEDLTTDKNMCLWQKCRGKVSGFLQSISKISTVSKIEVMRVFNLQKCVDASPTLFRYSNYKLFATVGSHAGMICTVEIQSTGIKSYEIKLPDRIEAAILVLHNFQGVVGCYDGYIYSLNLRTGQLMWQFRTEGIVKCAAIACQHGKRIFIGSYDFHVYCLSAKDGHKIWKVKVSNGSVSATGCLHLQTNSVLFGTLDGTCAALDQQTGEILWRERLKDPIFTAPIVLNDGLVILCTVAGVIHCFNIETKNKIWTYPTGGNVFAYPIIQQNVETKCESLVIASTNKNLYNFEFANGTKLAGPELKYILNFESAIYATPWYENDILLVACTDGTCKAVRHSKGEVLASIKLPGECFSSPVFADDIAFVGCRDNHVYGLRFS